METTSASLVKTSSGCAGDGRRRFGDDARQPLGGDDGVQRRGLPKA
jgi:hypothetical protein